MWLATTREMPVRRAVFSPTVTGRRSLLIMIELCQLSEVPVRASPVPSVVRGSFVVKFFCVRYVGPKM